MKRIQKHLADHRVATYCAVTFILTWGYWLITVYPRALPLMEAGKSVFSDSLTVMLIGAGMLFPAIGVVVTRLLTGEGFRCVWIKPVRFRRTWKYYVAGWLGPIALVAIGGAVYFLLNPNQFDPSMPMFVEAMQEQLGSAGTSAAMDESKIRMLGYAQLALVLVAPFLNCVTCFGEEWGWRGYLLQHMLEKRNVTFSIVVSGVIWGLWHAPITVLGHNYGLDYPGWPFLGIVAMCCFCVVLSCLFSWLTLRAKSCLPAVLAHGAVNSCISAPSMFLIGTPNPFIGPTATGIIGGIGFIVVAVLCLTSLRKRPEC